MTNNFQRVYAIDLARGFAIAFMIWVHVLITYANSNVQHSVFGMVIGFLGSPPAAPVFMLMMGISFCYSKKQDLWASVKRGILIIIFGYVLNFLRGVLPIWIAQVALPVQAAKIPLAVANLTDAMLELDILQFAGLALIVMALLRYFKINKYLLLLLALLIALVSPYSWNLQTPYAGFNHFLDYLWGNKPSTEECIGNLVSFPFFPWFVYPLVGMFIGEVLITKSTVEQTGLFKTIGIVGVVFLFIGIIIVARSPQYQFNDYYHHRAGFVLLMVGFVLGWFYLCYQLVDKIRPNWLFTLLYSWSQNVTNLYFIQWVLIMCGADWLFSFNHFNGMETALTMVIITILSHYISKGYIHLKLRMATDGK